MIQRLTRGLDRRKIPEASGNEIQLADQYGQLIAEDRRIIPDRRLHNISVEELKCSDNIRTIAEKKDQ
jgi:hypothetical protein